MFNVLWTLAIIYLDACITFPRSPLTKNEICLKYFQQEAESYEKQSNWLVKLTTQ